jgi:hypothetical protein
MAVQRRRPDETALQYTQCSGEPLECALWVKWLTAFRGCLRSCVLMIGVVVNDDPGMSAEGRYRDRLAGTRELISFCLFRETDRHGLPNVMLDQRSGCLALPLSFRRLSTPTLDAAKLASRQVDLVRVVPIAVLPSGSGPQRPAREHRQLTNRGNQSSSWYVFRHSSDIWSKRLRFALTCVRESQQISSCKHRNKFGKAVPKAPLSKLSRLVVPPTQKYVMAGSVRHRYVPWTFRGIN